MRMRTCVTTILFGLPITHEIAFCEYLYYKEVNQTMFRSKAVWQFWQLSRR